MLAATEFTVPALQLEVDLVPRPDSSAAKKKKPKTYYSINNAGAALMNHFLLLQAGKSKKKPKPDPRENWERGQRAISDLISLVGITGKVGKAVFQSGDPHCQA